MTSPLDQFPEEPSELEYIPPVYEAPREFDEYSPLTQAQPVQIPATLFNIMPHKDVGNDDGATNEPELPYQNSEQTSSATEHIIGSAAVESVTVALEQHDLPEPTEPLTTPEPTGPASRPFEIRRTEKHTLLTSTTHHNPELVDRVAEEFANGVPDDWPEYDNGTGSCDYRVDDMEDPTMFVKMRGDARTHKKTIEQLPDNMRQGDDFPGTNTYIRMRMSVANEMHVAPQAAAALRDDKAQEIVQASGFKSVDLVEPLVSIIDAETGQKATVYPWQPGESIAVTDSREGSGAKIAPEWTDRVVELTNMGDALAEYLETKGILADDLQLGNFIVETDENGDQHLHIIDPERFTRILPATPETTEAPTEKQEVTPPTETVEPAPRGPYQIRRREGLTVLASNTHPDAELAERVADKFSEGIPRDWPVFDNNTGTSKYRVDNLAEPRVFIKIRDNVADLKKDVGELSHPNPGPALRDYLTNVRAKMSVSSEMRIAPEIAEALGTAEAQAIVGRAGFDSVSLVQPLAAVIDIKTGEKATAYAWQPGESVGETIKRVADGRMVTLEGWANRFQKLISLSEELVAYLGSQGVRARDLKPHNLIISTDAAGKKHLHIIDIERSTRTFPESGSGKAT